MRTEKYDDIKWHSYADSFPAEMPVEYGATHIGLFLKWSFKKGWAGSLHFEDEESRSAVKDVIENKMTGTNFIINFCDGKLTDEDFNDAGNAFATAQYNQYMEDFGDYIGGQIYCISEIEIPFSDIEKMLFKRPRFKLKSLFSLNWLLK